MVRPVPEHVLDPDTGEIDFDQIAAGNAEIRLGSHYIGATMKDTGPKVWSDLSSLNQQDVKRVHKAWKRLVKAAAKAIQTSPVS
jgi:hypothetical protein